ncbi:hypothetical protein AB5N19_10223 [Seiridium cardinale]|uniref:Uncharacterized protein n=1 Tax=Seiridium cardinale TaxID=138064 RepID=A0ABR2XK06_9PEZI
MRFSASSLVAAFAFGSIASAQIAGVTKLTTDLTTFVTHLAAVPPNTGTLTTDLRRVVADVTALAAGAGGISGGSSLPTSNATALVTQITSQVCPALQTIEGKIPSLPVPTSIFSGLLSGAIETLVGVLRTLLGSLPAGVNVTPALTCLTNIVPAANVVRSSGATAPLEADVF